ALSHQREVGDPINFILLYFPLHCQVKNQNNSGFFR
ncbi:hypothetical protein SMU36_05675, partial [Streptococcus mutans 4VF1]